MEYGSSRYRVSDSSPEVTIVSGAVVAVSTTRYTGDHLLQAVDLAAGRTHRAEPVAAYAVAGRSVIAATVAAPGVLRTYALPSLEPGAEVALGGEARALAAGPDVIAAVLPDGVALVSGAEVRRVAVEAPTAIAFSPDGAWLAVGTETGRVAVVDVRKAAVARTLLGARVAIATLAWSADGSLLAAAGSKSAVVWPVAGGKAKSLYKAKHWASVVGFHGRLVLVHGTRQTLAAVDADTLHQAWEVNQYGPATLRGDRVVAARFEDIREIDASTGEILRRLAAPHIHVYSADLDGDTIVLGMSSGRRLSVGDLGSESWEPTPDGHEEEVLSLCFAGDRFATGGRDTRAIVWARGQAAPLVSVLPPSGSRTEHAEAVLLEGDTLWAGMGSRVHRFRVSDGAHEASAQLKDDVQVIVHTAGVILACAKASRRTYGELALLDPVTLAELHTERTSYTFSRGEVRGGCVRLVAGFVWLEYDVAARAFVDSGEIAVPASLRAERTLISPDEALAVELTDRRADDGEGWRGILRFIDLRTDSSIAEQETVATFGKADLDPAGAHLATCHSDGRVRLWDTRAGTLLREIDHPSAINGVRWLPDGGALLGWSLEGAIVELPDPLRR